MTESYTLHVFNTVLKNSSYTPSFILAPSIHLKLKYNSSGPYFSKDYFREMIRKSYFSISKQGIIYWDVTAFYVTLQLLLYSMKCKFTEMEKKRREKIATRRKTATKEKGITKNWHSCRTSSKTMNRLNLYSADGVNLNIWARQFHGVSTKG